MPPSSPPRPNGRPAANSSNPSRRPQRRSSTSGNEQQDESASREIKTQWQQLAEANKSKHDKLIANAEQIKSRRNFDVQRISRLNDQFGQIANRQADEMLQSRQRQEEFNEGLAEEPSEPQANNPIDQEQPANQLLNQAGQAVGKVVKKEVGTAAKALARQGFQTAAKAAIAAFAELNPIVWVVVGVIAVLIIVGFIIFALSLSASGNGTTAVQGMTAADRASAADILGGVGVSGGPSGRPGEPGNCDGITDCLQVPGVAEAEESHCGRASILMVLLYINSRSTAGGSLFDANKETIRNSNNILENNPRRGSCLPDNVSNQFSPSDRRGWFHVSWKKAPGNTPDEQKQNLLEWVKNSLKGDDPVVMYFLPGGIFAAGKGCAGMHIVTVAGFDPNDEGGTFLINNPKPPGRKVSGRSRPSGSVVTLTKFTDSGIKLTQAHVKEFIGGDGRCTYSSSVVMRQKYTTVSP